MQGLETPDPAGHLSLWPCVCGGSCCVKVATLFLVLIAALHKKLRHTISCQPPQQLAYEQSLQAATSTFVASHLARSIQRATRRYLNLTKPQHQRPQAPPEPLFARNQASMGGAREVADSHDAGAVKATTGLCVSGREKLLLAHGLASATSPASA